MEISPFFDERTSTLTYVVHDPATRDAVVLDPVLDYDPAASRTWTESVEQVIAFLGDKNLRLRCVLETHAHADHLSGSQIIKQACPDVLLAIGARITAVQEQFKAIFDLPDEFPTDGSQFDRLLQDTERLEVGSIKVDVMFTPGHTRADASYRIGDAVFTGDALFMPDGGTGRCDFPGGSAQDLHHSVTRRLYALPEATRVFTCHDYQPGGRELRYESTIGEEKRSNVALPATRSEQDFVRWRQERDATLSAPKLLFHSVQVNIDAGRMPPPARNEVRYLKLPLNAFKPATEHPERITLNCQG